MTTYHSLLRWQCSAPDLCSRVLSVVLAGEVLSLAMQDCVSHQPLISEQPTREIAKWEHSVGVGDTSAPTSPKRPGVPWSVCKLDDLMKLRSGGSGETSRHPRLAVFAGSLSPSCGGGSGAIETTDFGLPPFAPASAPGASLPYASPAYGYAPRPPGVPRIAQFGVQLHAAPQRASPSGDARSTFTMHTPWSTQSMRGLPPMRRRSRREVTYTRTPAPTSSICGVRRLGVPRPPSSPARHRSPSTLSARRRALSRTTRSPSAISRHSRASRHSRTSRKSLSGVGGGGGGGSVCTPNTLLTPRTRTADARDTTMSTTTTTTMVAPLSQPLLSTTASQLPTSTAVALLDEDNVSEVKAEEDVPTWLEMMRGREPSEVSDDASDAAEFPCKVLLDKPKVTRKRRWKRPSTGGTRVRGRGAKERDKSRGVIRYKSESKIHCDCSASASDGDATNDEENKLRPIEVDICSSERRQLFLEISHARVCKQALLALPPPPHLALPAPPTKDSSPPSSRSSSRPSLAPATLAICCPDSPLSRASSISPSESEESLGERSESPTASLSLSLPSPLAPPPSPADGVSCPAPSNSRHAALANRPLFTPEMSEPPATLKDPSLQKHPSRGRRWTSPRPDSPAPFIAFFAGDHTDKKFHRYFAPSLRIRRLSPRRASSPVACRRSPCRERRTPSSRERRPSTGKMAAPAAASTALASSCRRLASPSHLEPVICSSGDFQELTLLEAGPEEESDLKPCADRTVFDS